ncbi:MAG: YwiC-like family protein [Nitrospirota bacterium]
MGSLNIPYTREPGSWIIFAIAFVTGTVKAGRIDLTSIILLISLALFLMAKTPFSNILKKKGRSELAFILLYITIGSLGCLYSISIQPSMLFLYIAGIILISLYFIFGRKGFLLLSEASGMATMGLVSAIAAGVGGEILSKIYLWPMFFIFYFASSLRVRFAITKYRLLSRIYSGIILTVSGVMIYTGKLIFLSFLPLLEDFYSALKVKKEGFKRLGVLETIKALIFAFILILIDKD